MNPATVILCCVGAAILAGFATAVWWTVGRGPRRQRAYRRALRLLHEQRWQAALAAVAELHDLGPLPPLWQGRARNAEAQCHSLAGDLALQEQRYEDALQHHQTAADLFHADPGPGRDRVLQVMLAEVRRLFAEEDGRRTEPVHKAIDRLLALQRPCPEASFWQALCHVREGRVDQAVEALHEARASPKGMDPGRQASGTDERTPAPPPTVTRPAVDPPLYLGALLLRQGLIREGLQYLAEANRIAPDSPFVSWQLGLGIVASGGDRLAVRALQRALAPQGLPRWTSNAQRGWVEGLPEGSFVRRMAEERPFRCPVFGSDVAGMVRQGQMALAQAHYRTGHFAEAAQVYTTILQDAPPSPPVLRGLGLSLARLERYDEAFKYLRIVHEQAQREPPGQQPPPAPPAQGGEQETPPLAKGGPGGVTSDAHDTPEFLVAGYLALCAARGKPLQPEDRPNNIRWAVGLLSQFEVRGNVEWACLVSAVHAEARAAGVALPAGDQLPLADVLASVDAADPSAALVYDAVAGLDPAAVRLEHACLYVRAVQLHGLRSDHELRLFERVFQEEEAARVFFERRGGDFGELLFLYLDRWAARQPGSFPAVFGADFAARGEELLLARSRGQEEAGQLDAAWATADTLLALSPRNPRALDRLAYLCHRRGDLDRAVGLLEDLHAAGPRDHRPLVRKAVIQAHQGDTEGCFESIDRAMAQTHGRARSAVALVGARLALAGVAVWPGPSPHRPGPALKPEAPAKGTTTSFAGASGFNPTPGGFHDSTVATPDGEQLGRARRYLEECLREEPGHPQALWRLAALLHTQGDQPALAALAPAMRLHDVSDPRFSYLAAVCEFAAGEYDRAVQAAERARLDPALAAESLHLIGLAHTRRNDLASAAAALADVLTEAPESPSARHTQALLARNRFLAGDYAAAVRSWTALDPEPRSRWGLDEPLRQTVYLGGVLALRAGRFADAVGQLAEAERLGLPCTPLLNLSRVRAAQELLGEPSEEPGLVPLEEETQARGRWLDLTPAEDGDGRGSAKDRPGPEAKAAQLLTDALQADAADAGVAHLLAATQIRLGRWEAARQALQAQARPDAQTHFLMGLCSLQLGQLAQAAGEFARAWQEQPADTAAGYNLVLTDLSLGQTDAAAAVVGGVLERAADPDERRRLGLLQALLRGGQEPDARLLEMGREDEQDLLNLVRGLGHLDTSESLLKALAVSRPHSPAVGTAVLEATLLRARGLLDRGRWHEAWQLLSPHSAAKVPLDSRLALLNLLGCAACLVQDFGAGVKHFSLACQLSDDARLHQNLALAYELQAQGAGQAGPSAVAERQWEHFVELLHRRIPSPPRQPDYHRRLAFECLSRLATRASDKEQWGQALAYLQRAREVRPDDVELLERLVQMYQQLKRPEQARQVVRQMQRLRPDDPQYALAELDLAELRTAEDVAHVVAELQRLRRKHPDHRGLEGRAAVTLANVIQAIERLSRSLADQIDRTRSRVRRRPDYQVDWPEVQDFSRHTRSRLNKLADAAEQALAAAATDAQRRPLEEVIALIERQLDLCRGLAREASRR